MKKDWLEVVAKFVLVFVVAVFLGYFWRMHHEFKNIEKWKREVVRDFLMEVERERAVVFKVQDWEFVKRADGSVVMRRR